MDWEDVYSFLERVGPGRVVSYGDIARHFRSTGRAVGTCLNAIRERYRRRDKVSEDRTHRVVEDNGTLTDRPGGLNTQRRQLEAEGVTFVGDKVDFAKHRLRI